MSLPIKAIDRLFERLLATYGDEFSRKWGAVPIADVKTVWANELAGFANRLDAIVFALENLPEKAPNALQFRSLCRSAPMPPTRQLPPPPPADPVRMREELEKLGFVRERAKSPAAGRDWARTLQARIDSKEIRPTLAQRQMVRAALRESLNMEAEAA